MRAFSTVAWFAILSSLVTGWIAVIFAVRVGDLAGGVGLLAAAFAFGLPAIALLVAVKR